jgi:hypothetical protein
MLLAEIHRQLVDVHYPLAEARAVDVGLHRRTLQRLDGLLRHVDRVLTELEQQER